MKKVGLGFDMDQSNPGANCFGRGDIVSCYGSKPLHESISADVC